METSQFNNLIYARRWAEGSGSKNKTKDEITRWKTVAGVPPAPIFAQCLCVQVSPDRDFFKRKIWLWRQLWSTSDRVGSYSQHVSWSQRLIRIDGISFKKRVRAWQSVVPFIFVHFFLGRVRKFRDRLSRPHRWDGNRQISRKTNLPRRRSDVIIIDGATCKNRTTAVQTCPAKYVSSLASLW